MEKLTKYNKLKTIHALIIKDNKEYYLCNQAVRPIQDKIRYNWNKVTCKNCINIIKSIEKNKDNW